MFMIDVAWNCVGVFFLGRRRVVFPVAYLFFLLLR
jgi:hypothetical protein